MFTRNTGKTVLAGLVMSMLAASTQAQDNPTQPPNGWMKYGLPISISLSKNGLPDKYTCGSCVKTSTQSMTTDINLTIYKNAVPTIDGYDYYLVTGTQRHSVAGSSSNLISGGMYGQIMGLTMSAAGGRMWDYGPTTTVGGTTAGFNVGANIGASGSGPSGGASFGYSQSFSTPSVTFSSSGNATTASITTNLPHNSQAASSVGYNFESAVVFQVPAGHGLSLSLVNEAKWEYDYPKGLALELYRAWASSIIQADFSNKQIVQNSSGLCMSVDANSNIVLDHCTGAANEKWSYTGAGQLQSAMTTDSPMCLDTEDSPVVSGTRLVVHACDPYKASQKFRVGQMWYLKWKLTGQDTSYQVAPGVTLLFPGLTCYTSSPTNYQDFPTTCDAFPTEAPTSSTIQTEDGALAATTDFTGAPGVPLLLQPSRVDDSVPGRMITTNHFFQVQ